MSQATLQSDFSLSGDRPSTGNRQAIIFATVACGLAITAAVIAGWAPIGFSIVTVFLFAGPHNWYEFRYFLSRMPARWGPRRTFYWLGILGALGLSVLFALISWIGLAANWSPGTWAVTSSSWNSLLILWLATLVWLRMREIPDRDPAWVWPVALAVIGVAWLVPSWWDLGLVYLHPLIALVFLQRELRRHRPQWLPGYYVVVCLLPVLLGVLWWHLASTPHLPGNDALTARITSHAGSQTLSNISSHLLVATHTFLETIHYGVWLLVIPLLTFGKIPWRVSKTPIAKKSNLWRWIVRGVIFGGGVMVLCLWGFFLTDYAITRDVYFTVAIFHVLAEFTFLIGTI